MDASIVKKDFPQLARVIRGKPLVYLDSTATSLKPQSVLDKMHEYYTQYTANIFRGIYVTSEEATREYENARTLVADFIGAKPAEVIFTRNTSESLNLVAYSWAISNMQPGDEVVTTIMEHHSNFVPWQQMGAKHGWRLKVWDVTPDYTLDIAALDKLITRKTKLLTLTAVSNVLGTINPVAEIVAGVKKINPECLVMVDAAQAVPHMKVDVGQWGADFVAFSSHKMLGPTGVGVLWGKYALLDRMEPFMYGGEMISEVTVASTVFKEPPHKFETGTPDIAGAIGLGAAVTYLQKLGMDEVRAHEVEITRYALAQLSQIKGVNVVGPTDVSKRGGVAAFTMDDAHPHDIAQILDEDNVCIRAGSHCAMPLHQCLSLPATARVSFYVYTTKEDVDALVAGLERVKKLFS